MGAMAAGSNVVSVAEHVVMLILSMVRNYLPAHKQIVDGEWDIGAAASKAYDLQCKTVGTVGTGAIGQLVLQRLQVGSQPAGTLQPQHVTHFSTGWCMWTHVQRILHNNYSVTSSTISSHHHHQLHAARCACNVYLLTAEHKLYQLQF